VGTRSDYSTRPRELIAAALRAEPRFLTAAEIHRVLESGQAKVSISTVYRTLEHLLSKGEVTVRSDDAGEASYMLCEPDHHHHHAICRVCGRVEDVDCDAIDSFTESLRTIHGFKLDGHNMEFHGTCRQCQ
jgi:Fur family transcriptional regulator, ferric uptake regulator